MSRKNVTKIYGVYKPPMEIPLDVYACFSPLEKYGSVPINNDYYKKITLKGESMAALTLQEIIWEVTNKCNKKCDYCGSKAFVNNGEKIADPIEVAGKIAKYPPKEITLSGGEPGTLDENTLQLVTDILRGNGIQVKCVTNGAVITNDYEGYFDWIGLSINDEEDLRNFENNNYSVVPNLTIITNFGTHNIWLYEKIKKIIYRKQGGIIPWQIQLTQGKLQLPADGIKYLREKIAKENSPKIIKADNLQDCRNCFAGIHSCGITYDGQVIPCLSMRSWADNVDPQGNILEHDLETIWKEGFKNYRFGKMPCCRDSLDYGEEKTGFEEFPKSDMLIDPNTIKNPELIQLLYGVQMDYDKKKPWPNMNGGVSVYAVTTPQDFEKGQKPWDSSGAIAVYAAFSPFTTSSSTDQIVYDLNSGKIIRNSQKDK